MENEQHTAELIKGAIAAHLDISVDLLIDLEASGNLDEVVKAVLGTRALEASQADEEIARLQRLALDCAEGKAQVNIGEDGANFVLASGEMVYVPRLTTPTRIEAARAIEIGRKLDAEDGGYPPPIQAAGDVEKMKVLLPPASVDQEFLDGWISGQQYLILNYGSKEEFDEAVATPPQAAESGLVDEAIDLLRRIHPDPDYATIEQYYALLAKAGKQGEGDREG